MPMFEGRFKADRDDDGTDVATGIVMAFKGGTKLVGQPASPRQLGQQVAQQASSL